MTGLLICAAMGLVAGFAALGMALMLWPCRPLRPEATLYLRSGLALIAAALYLAWRAGGA